MTELRSEFLFELRLEADLAEVQKVGPTPSGDRRIAPIRGGTFAGPRLRGKVLPGGADWVRMRTDGARDLDVRLTLETDDGQLIYLAALGIWDISPENFARAIRKEPVAPEDLYFRTTPRFEVAGEKYAWLNRVVAVTIGRLDAATVVHTIYAIL